MCCARKAAAAASPKSKNHNEKSSTSDLGAMVDAMNTAKSVSAASAAFRKPAAFVPSYGTAGFRAEASLLDSTLFR